MRGFLVLVACLLPSVALAQLDLSGATPPAPAGTVVRPAPVKPKAPRVPRAVPAARPAESALGGRTLSLNGGRSQVTFALRDKTIDVARLLLAGHKLSNGRDECQVDVSGMPLVLTPLDKANGLARFSIPLSACPLSFDVLSGAIVTHADVATCSFKEADCQAAVVGLWGAQPGDLGADQVKAIERDRTTAEKEVRAAYKGLVSSTKDRAVIKDYASDQAAFSSHREEACRDYIGESRHGFCAARFTQARATSLQAALVVAQAAKEERRRKQAGRSSRR